jgi:hypothetical protein
VLTGFIKSQTKLRLELTHLVVVQSDKPFTGLTKFGTAFLSKFECAQCNNELLNEVPPPFPKTCATKLAG